MKFAGPLSVLLSGLAIAAAVMLASRWQIVPDPMAGVARLDHWTGAVVRCVGVPGDIGAGSVLECDYERAQQRAKADAERKATAQAQQVERRRRLREGPCKGLEGAQFDRCDLDQWMRETSKN